MTPPTRSPAMWTRRQFLQRLTAAGLLGGGAGYAYALHEAKACQVNRQDIALPGLPAAFEGTTVAFLADTHFGPGVPLEYLSEVVAMTNALRPDLVALGGDYVQRQRFKGFLGGRRRYIAAGVAVLGGLRAPLGRFAVLGNHDHRESAMLTRRALRENGLSDLTNTGVWLERGGARLRICGVDDCRFGRPHLNGALGDARPGDACLLLTHNPDYVETIRDRRVGCVLSGHTHGGQVVLPFFGPPFNSSRYGWKYLAGLSHGPVVPVFVTRGVGTIGPPVRFGAPPEVALLTLRRDRAA